MDGLDASKSSVKLHPPCRTIPMSSKDWLPITTRNRVALLLASAGLVMFVVWNCLPDYEYPGATEPDGIVAMSLWPDEILSPDFYIMVLRDPDVEGFLVIAAFTALVQSAVVSLAAVVFWKALHASSYVRLPLAVVNLFGGGVVLWHLRDHGSEDNARHWIAILSLMSLNMFALSAALFTFRNELGLRSEKEVREATGKGGEA
jgi:hypothetical protein